MTQEMRNTIVKEVMTSYPDLKGESLELAINVAISWEKIKMIESISQN